MGRFQKSFFVVMVAFSIFYGVTAFVQIFITLTPQNHWCRVPELANLSIELRRNLSTPGADTGDWNRCMTFDTNWTETLNTLTPPPNGTPMISCPYGWEFELSDVPYETVTTEREWVCDRASYLPTAQSVFSVGSVIGNFIYGCVSDRYGRIPTIVVTNLIATVGGIATVFTTGFWDFVFCRFLVGTSFDTCMLTTYILFLEYLGPQYRTLIGNLALAISYSIVFVTLPWLAFYIADWRKLLWVTSLPGFLVIATSLYLPESVRWLLSRGHTNKIVKILHRLESMNGRIIPKDVLNIFILSCNKVKHEDKKSFISLIKSPPLLKALLILMLLTMGVGVITDGLTRLSGSLGLNIFVVFSSIAITEFFANIIVAVTLDRAALFRNVSQADECDQVEPLSSNRSSTLSASNLENILTTEVNGNLVQEWGRRNITGVPIVICGVALVGALFMDEGYPRAILAVCARFLSGIAFSSSLQWSTEILPTPVRASGTSILHISYDISVMISPYIVYLEYLWKLLPVVILAIIAFFTAVTTLALPETEGLPMTQTLADGEKIIQERSLCRKRGKASCFL